MIAQDFAKSGAQVTLLEGPVTRPLESTSLRVLKFSFFDEFVRLIRKELKKKYAICIHAAAVSDYKVRQVKRTKLSSRLLNYKLDLVPTEKIVRSIKKMDPDLFLVAFKLELKMVKATARRKAQELFQKSKCDLVVANSAEGQKYSGYILDQNGALLAHKRSRQQLSKALVSIVKDHV